MRCWCMRDKLEECRGVVDERIYKAAEYSELGQEVGGLVVVCGVLGSTDCARDCG